MFIHIVRIIYLLVVMAFTTSFASQQQVIAQGPTYITLYILVPVLCSVCLVLMDMFWRKKKLQILSGLFFGLLAGLAIAYVLGKVVDLTGFAFGMTTVQSALPAAAGTVDPVMSLVKVLLGVSAVFMCVSFVLQTKDDFRFVIPYVEFSKQTKGARPLLLDTSVIIDGRIADISDTRILESQVIVPRFVLAELQAIADSDDKLKRNRGRRGLDVLNRLRGSEKIDIEILDARIPTVEATEEVDSKLVALAEHLDGRIITNDYNLNKIAQLRGVAVININDLANALKPIVLPGESMGVKVIKPGEEPGQGIGYLEDGTMVVAEQGRDYIGREIVITVTSVLQTSAGRMIFGRLDPERTFGPREKKV